MRIYKLLLKKVEDAFKTAMQWILALSPSCDIRRGYFTWSGHIDNHFRLRFSHPTGLEVITALTLKLCYTEVLANHIVFILLDTRDSSIFTNQIDLTLAHALMMSDHGVAIEIYFGREP